MQDGDQQNGDRNGRQSRGVRFEIAIAVCALLISCLASAASWWQARLLSEQTHVLELQLGAQVWPYVGLSEGIDGSTVTISVVNDGLGPAIIRSEVARVDGVPRSSMIGVLHAVLGSKLKGHGERIQLNLNGGSPGSVLRAGDSLALMTLTSQRLARPFARAAQRVSFAICYCAIIPGQCWLTDSANNADPRPLRACSEIPGDLMHGSMAAQLKL